MLQPHHLENMAFSVSVVKEGQLRAPPAAALGCDSEVTHVTSAWNSVARIFKSLCPVCIGGWETGGGRGRRGADGMLVKH